MKKRIGLLLLLSLCVQLFLFPYGAMVRAEEQTSSSKNFLDGMITEEKTIKPSLTQEEPLPDLSNVLWSDWFREIPELCEPLLKNHFVISSGNLRHFANIYEKNRYSYNPNFVTTDSLLHTYHLYFNFLMKVTEKNDLVDELRGMLQRLAEVADAQQDLVAGSEFEEAAKLELAALIVARSLLDEETQVPEAVKDIVVKELELIRAADGIHESEFMGDEDYSQYTPRGHYAGDEVLEAYFKCMMFLGRLNLKFSEDTEARAAALMTLALAEDKDALGAWEKIYRITAFFAGESDDHGYGDVFPLLKEVFGEKVDTKKILENEKSWPKFVKKLKELPPPEIHSIVRHDDRPDEDKVANGFRLMGQRFNWDAAIFQQLIYSAVKDNPKGERRYLPDFLDVPAVYDSQLAVELLEEQGAFAFENYPENMAKMKEKLAANGDQAWTASLSSAWQYCLLPLLEVKREGYPRFMQSEAWDKKKLECFAGSYVELKHDTVLYAKQAMAEMGGAGMLEKRPDDRGYVEPEPEVFGRLARLATITSDGLKELGALGKKDEENLGIFIELAERLQLIAEKELMGELPTEEEFELIRSIGGQLEHLYYETFRDQDERLTDYPPAALITDIATNPNGEVLHIANGNPQVMYVIVEVEGQLRIASGPVYNFYQFVVPSLTRLTDKQWQILIGAEYNFGDIEMPENIEVPEKPEWTGEYRQKPDQPQTGLHEFPGWVEWKEGAKASSDLSFRSELSQQKLVLTRNGQPYWKTPSEYKVQDFHFCDMDGDDKDEAVLLVWKKGRYGDSRPFGWRAMS